MSKAEKLEEKGEEKKVEHKYKINLTSSNLTYEPLHLDTGKPILSDFFNRSTNPKAVASYADGSHYKEERIDAKVKLWGGRDEKGDECRCFVVSTKDGGDKLGYVNIGATTITYKGKPCIEFGMFMTDGIMENTHLMTEAAKAVLGTYAGNTFAATHGAVVGTLNTSHPYGGTVLTAAGFHVGHTKGEIQSDAVLRNLGLPGINLEGTRFSYDSSNNLLESEAPKNIFALEIAGDSQDTSGWCTLL